jgi:hypothetical protein
MNEREGWEVARKLVCLALIEIMLGAAVFAAEVSDDKKAAMTSAEVWLILVDEGKYRESWEQAAGYFRQAVSEDQWEQAVQGVRKPLGALVSRKVARAEYATTLPGAPDGRYYVIEFESSFENKKSAVETVVPMMDEDCAWRVSGYFIR